MKKLLVISLMLFLAGCTTASKCAQSEDQAACEKEAQDQMKMDRTINRGHHNL